MDALRINVDSKNVLTNKYILPAFNSIELSKYETRLIYQDSKFPISHISVIEELR